MARSIAEIYHTYDIKELHVSLSNGLWRYETWGYPVVDAAPGAEVWAWFNNGTDGSRRNPDSIDVQWKNLCATLSGLLCASLSFIDATNTQSPEYSFRPQFYAKKQDWPVIRYSNLPHEIVCTENMTPWKKLLPCGNRGGFLSLLNSEHVHSTSYHSIGIHMRQLDDSLSGKVLEVKQTVNLVFDQIQLGGKDWSIRKLFGQGMGAACPLAKTSKLYVDVTEAKKAFDFTPQFDEVINSRRGGSDTEFGVFDMKKQPQNKMFNFAAIKKAEAKEAVPIIPVPILTARRFLLGVGQERGQIVTKIANNHWSDLNVIVQENIPWFVPIYLHTLKIRTLNGVELTPTSIIYKPGKQRERPYQLEVAVKVPSRTTIELSIDFDYIFLKWQEYPPDANHGHYIGAAVVSALLPVAKNYTGVPVDGCLFADSFNASRSGYLVQIHTESLLLTLPTPDFSMPYNVICLSCTVVALAFGPIHSMTTKRITVQKRDEPQSMLGKLKQKLRQTIGKRKEAESIAEAEPQEEEERTTKEVDVEEKKDR